MDFVAPPTKKEDLPKDKTLEDYRELFENSAITDPPKEEEEK